MEKKKWTSYGEIYNAIVSAMTNDYAGAKDRKAWNDPHVAARVSLFHSRSFHGDDAEFLRLVRLYLGLFGDPNLSLKKAGSDPIRDWQPGFSVRADEDFLYVTKAPEEERLHPGDKIRKLGGLPVPDFRKGNRGRLLCGDVPERENWDYFLQYADSFEAESEDGSRRTLKTKHFPVQEREERTEFRRLDENYFYVRLDSFDQVEKIEQNSALHAGELDECPVLILDLRCCRGGDPEGLMPLLPWMAEGGASLEELMGEEGYYLLCSHKNCRRIAQEMEREEELIDNDRCYMEGNQCQNTGLQQAEQHQSMGLEQTEHYQNIAFEEVEQYRSMLREEKERILSFSGKGFIWEEAEVPEEWKIVQSSPFAQGPRRLILLTDTFTCREAELLAKSRKGKKDTVIAGRATRGDTLYRELVTVSFEDDLFFTYPAAKSKEAMESQGIPEAGVLPDVVVPWTPQEIREDMLLKQVLQLS